MAANALRNSSYFTDIEILEQGLGILCKNNAVVRALVDLRHTEIISLLCKYISQIELYNPALGLVGTTGRQELIRRHILDSLAPLGLFCRLLESQNCFSEAQGNIGDVRIADVGSGAGLPGIPLAIVMPQAYFTLIECMRRRAGFLRDALKILALSNVTVIEDEAEKFAHNAAVNNSSDAALFNLVTFRAFKPLEPKILKSLFRLCCTGGVLAAYKGRREKIEKEVSALEKYAGAAGKSRFLLSGCEIIPCPTPLLAEERHILLIRGRANSGGMEQ